ncbi:hypothetical protein ACFLZZ_00310 [Nanoarchaeota archaeon]
MKVEYTPPKKVDFFEPNTIRKHKIKIILSPGQVYNIEDEESLEGIIKIPKKDKKTITSKKLILRLKEKEFSNLIRFSPSPNGEKFNSAKEFYTDISRVAYSMLRDSNKITSYTSYVDFIIEMSKIKTIQYGD